MLEKVDFDITSSIEKAILPYLDAEKDFLSFDITKSIRLLFPRHSVPYAEIRRLLSRIMVNNKEYKKIEDEDVLKEKYQKVISQPVPDLIPHTTPVDLSLAAYSSFIEEIAYLQKTKLLLITIKNRVFVYEDVEYSVFEAFKDADSLGAFYNKHIRGKYTSNTL